MFEAVLVVFFFYLNFNQLSTGNKKEQRSNQIKISWETKLENK